MTAADFPVKAFAEGLEIDVGGVHVLVELGSGRLANVARRHGDGLEARLRDLEKRHGDEVYAELIYLLSHLRFDPATASAHWRAIAEHPVDLEQRLGAPVELRVALLNFFVQVNVPNESTGVPGRK